MDELLKARADTHYQLIAALHAFLAVREDFTNVQSHRDLLQEMERPHPLLQNLERPEALQ